MGSQDGRKWLVINPHIYKPFRQFGRGPTTLLRGLTNRRGYESLSSWHDPPSDVSGFSAVDSEILGLKFEVLLFGVGVEIYETWVFPKIWENSPKLSILIGFSGFPL